MSKHAKSTNLKNLVAPILRNKWILLISFFGVLFTVGVLTVLSDRIYEAIATLSIRQLDTQQNNSMNFPNFFQRQLAVKNQVSVLKSRRLASNVIDQLRISEYRDSLQILKAHVVSHRDKIFNQIPFLKTEIDTGSHPATQKESVRRFRKATRVLFERDTDILELRGRANSPWEAASLVNKWVEAYLAYHRSDTQGEVSQTKVFIQKKVREAERRLIKSEKRLAQYKKDEKVVALNKETEQQVMQLANFQSLHSQTKTDLEAVENQLFYLKQQLDESKRNLVEDITKTSSPVLKQLQSSLADLVARKAAFEAQLLGAGYSASGSTKLIEMENRIEGIREKIIEESNNMVNRDLTRINPLDRSENLVTMILELETEQKSLSAKSNALKKIVDEYNEQLKELPAKSLNLARLERDVQVNDKIYMMLRENLEEMRIREAGQLAGIHVVDFAEPPLGAIRPRTMLNLFLACFFGLILGFGIILGKDYFEDIIHSSEDLENLGIKIIGTVPLSKHHKSIKSDKDEKKLSIHRARQIYPYLLSQLNGYSSIAESYRAIRTSLYLTNMQKNYSTLLFTSPGPSEGKSTTSANIAITMAQRGVKTLLIDCDLRRPVLDVLFMGSHRKMGITNYLAQEVSWKEALRETSINGLYLMGAGTGVKNASELLSSKLLAKFIHEAKEEFGLILFDSPPLLPVTDATILASLVDGVVLIVRNDKTAIHQVKSAMDLLKNVSTKLFGAILLGLKPQDSYAYKDYYGTYMENLKDKKL